MARKKKVTPVSFETAQKLITIMRVIAKQAPRKPVSKVDMALQLGCKTSELTNEYRLLGEKNLAVRRTGEEARGIYLKLTTEGRALLKGWTQLFQ